MANFCPECGKAVESADHKFCPECGSNMSARQSSSQGRDVSETKTPRRPWRVYTLVGAGVVMLLGTYLAFQGAPSLQDVSEESITGVSDIVSICDATADYCAFLVQYQDGTEETITSGDRSIFAVNEAGGGAESLTVKTITTYESGFLGLTRSREVRGVRKLYEFTVEQEDYDRYWQVVHGDQATD